MLSDEKKQAMEEARCRLLAIERIQADRLTTQVIPEADAAWGSMKLAQRAERFLRLASELEAMERKCA